MCRLDGSRWNGCLSLEGNHPFGRVHIEFENNRYDEGTRSSCWWWTGLEGPTPELLLGHRLLRPMPLCRQGAWGVTGVHPQDREGGPGYHVELHLGGGLRLHPAPILHWLSSRWRIDRIPVEGCYSTRSEKRAGWRNSYHFLIHHNPWQHSICKFNF